MPLPFILSIPRPKCRECSLPLADAPSPDMALFFSVFLSNLLYIVTLIWLIVLLAGPSEAAQCD